MSDVDQWVIVEPGVIALPTTGYEIRHEEGRFVCYRNGKKIGGHGAMLGTAKAIIAVHMRDLLDVGIEP